MFQWDARGATTGWHASEPECGESVGCAQCQLFDFGPRGCERYLSVYSVALAVSPQLPGMRMLPGDVVVVRWCGMGRDFKKDGIGRGAHRLLLARGEVGCEMGEG
jgi:hypothetical protein